MSLTSKVMKTKKLQRLSTGFVMIIPKNWLNELNWTRADLFRLVFRPDKKEIVMTKIENEKISDPEPEAN